MIPYFAPVVLRFDTMQVQLFGVLQVIAVTVGMVQLVRRGVQLGQPASQSVAMATSSLCVALICSHLFELVAYHPGRLLADDLRLVLALLVNPTAGLSSVGGFLGGTIGMLMWSRRRRVEYLIPVDSMLFAFPSGWLFARLGCFTTHDHPGIPTQSIFGVDFGPGPLGGVRHDLGLYEVFWALLMMILFQWLSQRPRPIGLYSALATLLYAPMRFLFDFLRVGDRRYFSLTPAQYGMMVMFGLGCFLLCQVQSRLRSQTAGTP